MFTVYTLHISEAVCTFCTFLIMKASASLSRIRTDWLVFKPFFVSISADVELYKQITNIAVQIVKLK